MTARRHAPRWPVPFALVVGLATVALLAIVYPLLASRTQNPLAIFVVQTFLVAAFGTAGQTALVGAAATAVAALEGAVADELDGAALAARLTIIVVSGAIGVAIAAQRVRRQRQLDEALERSVLIDAFQSSLAPVPAPPADVRVEIRFRFGDERLQLGGDFVDAIELPDGALGYIIGDVCGHGVRSTALGSAMRTGWKTIATHAPSDPATWVAALERAFFRLGRREGYVTLNTGRLDVASRRIRFVSAGHPWPIVLTDRATLTRPVVSQPVGIAPAAPRTCTELELPCDATLLLYTDGLYEHPGTTEQGIDGEAALLRYLDDAPRPVDLDALLDRFGRGGYDDDVALMTISTSA